MPLYEYRCRDCQHDFELLVRESTVLECPACRSAALEKQLSVFAVMGDQTLRRQASPAPCGSCGHPDGPGSCSIN
ncbi:MAG: zinc ribbon domain-containing protein [Vicinamibacterales bacterium]